MPLTGAIRAGLAFVELFADDGRTVAGRMDIPNGW